MGDKFTVHGLTDADRQTILAAFRQQKLGTKAEVADKTSVKGVLVANKADYMAVRTSSVRAHLGCMTQPCTYE